MPGDVEEFYDEHPINEAQILAALRRAGRDVERLAPEDLYAYDQDHYGGLAAVDALAERARLAPGVRLLDVCCGLGGPARYVARKYGADVVGVDLNRGRAPAAARLTALVGLSDRARFVRGDATRLPFADASFDAAIAQEAFLHIADKPALFAACRRVLRPGGSLAFTDWIAFADLSAGDRSRLADGIMANDIQSLDSYRRLLQDAGFREVETENLSTAWRDILRERLEMFRGMEADTVRLFGTDRHARYISAYEFFVERITAGALGGGRFTARA
jgi:cyclopropane fatty-acyl-phospholipid synthase-like methyltransferase